MSLMKTQTPDYIDNRAEISTPWDWLKALLSPAAVQYLGQRALTSRCSAPPTLRTWLVSLSRTKSPAYHKPTQCKEPGKSPDAPREP